MGEPPIGERRRFAGIEPELEVVHPADELICEQPSNANGLPPLSAMISWRTGLSTGPVSTVSSNARASWGFKALRTSRGSPVSSSVGTRAEKTSPTDSIPSRRATKARTWAEA